MSVLDIGGRCLRYQRECGYPGGDRSTRWGGRVARPALAEVDRRQQPGPETSLGRRFDPILLGQRQRQRPVGEKPQLDQDLTQTTPALRLAQKGSLKLVVAHKPLGNKQPTQRPPGNARRFHHRYIGTTLPTAKSRWISEGFAASPAGPRAFSLLSHAGLINSALGAPSLRVVAVCHRQRRRHAHPDHQLSPQRRERDRLPRALR